jgi:hypothetical protein
VAEFEKEVKNREAKKENVVKEVLEHTGLPQNLVSEDLNKVLEQIGVTPDQCTIEDLRKAMMIYLEEVIADLELAEIEN